MEPNVLLVVLDALRADHTSIHGYDRPTTPALEALAADGHVFDRAFTAAPWTPASHGSLFAGVHPSTHGYLDGNVAFTPPHAPLAAVLADRGYRTFGAARNPKIAGHTQVTRGFQDYGDLYTVPSRPDSLGETKRLYLDLLPGWVRTGRDWLRCERWPAEHLTGSFVKRRIRRHAGSEPFFGFVNVNAPHSPYAPPERFGRRFESDDAGAAETAVVDDLVDRGGYRFMAGELDPTPEEWAAVQDRYDGEIAFADAILGRLLDVLRTAGVYDETLVVVTADHGEHFGEHGRAYHQFSLFDELLHVPLVVKFPAGTTADDVPTGELVSLVDLYPTVLAALGIPVPETVEGQRIGTDSSREHVVAEYGTPETAIATLVDQATGPVPDERHEALDHALQCVRTSEEKYVRVHGGTDRVYDVGAGRPKDSLRREGSHERLASVLDDVVDTELDVSTPEPADETAREQLENLGYL